MLEIDHSRFIFKTRTIWFSEVPFDVDGFDEISFHACTKDVNLAGFSKEAFTTLVIDLNQDLDILWKRMEKSCRKSIDKSREDGIIIRLNQGYDIFKKINSEFREAKGLPKSNIDIEFMEKNGILFLSEFEGKILGGSFYLNDGKNIRGLLSASKRLEETGKMRTLIGNANRLMVWESITYAKKYNMSTFDMGGYYTGSIPDTQKEGINKFKKSFGGELVTHYIYRKEYSKVYSLSKWIYSKIMD